jgi:hypothetical protein
MAVDEVRTLSLTWLKPTLLKEAVQLGEADISRTFQHPFGERVHRLMILDHGSMRCPRPVLNLHQ